MRFYLILVFISLIFVLLQVSFLPAFNLYSDIALAYILAFTYLNRSNLSISVAFSTGILLDGLSNSTFGVFTLFYTVFSILSLYVFNFFGNRFIALPVTAFIFFIAEILLLNGFVFANANIVSGISTALFSCFLYPLIIFICGRFGKL